MFHFAYTFNVDISQWDVRNVKNMAYMFCHAPHFNANVGKWNVKSVELFVGMFEWAENYQGGEPQWDRKKHENFERVMFKTHPWQAIANNYWEYITINTHVVKWMNHLSDRRRKEIATCNYHVANNQRAR